MNIDMRRRTIRRGGGVSVVVVGGDGGKDLFFLVGCLRYWRDMGSIRSKVLVKCVRFRFWVKIEGLLSHWVTRRMSRLGWVGIM